MSTRRLTVVQTLPALESGGVERGTLEIGKALVDSGHRSIVISGGGRLVGELEREGSEHLAWPIGEKSLFTLRRVPALREFLQRERVDILHARSRLPAWIAWLAWRSMPAPARPRLITTVHGLYSVNAYSAVMVKGERVIAVSQTVRDYILMNYPQVDPARIEVIYRGVDPADYAHGFRPDGAWLAAWQAQYPQLAGRQLLTLPGRITRLKGHDAFLRLIARLVADGLPVHGLIVGGAEARKRAYLAELQALSASLGIDQHLTFTGQRSDLREIMAVSTLVLSLSTQPESFGRTVLEALSLGIPVAGNAHGGVGEVLARLYPAGLIDDWAGQRERKSGEALHARVCALLLDPPPLPASHPFVLQAMLAREIALYQELHAAAGQSLPSLPTDPPAGPRR